MGLLLRRWCALNHAARLAGTALGGFVALCVIAAAQAAALQDSRRLRTSAAAPSGAPTRTSG
jgi:hypothetical protein